MPAIDEMQCVVRALIADMPGARVLNFDQGTLRGTFAHKTSPVPVRFAYSPETQTFVLAGSRQNVAITDRVLDYFDGLFHVPRDVDLTAAQTERHEYHPVPIGTLYGLEGGRRPGYDVYHENKGAERVSIEDRLPE